MTRGDQLDLLDEPGWRFTARKGAETALEHGRSQDDTTSGASGTTPEREEIGATTAKEGAPA